MRAIILFLSLLSLTSACSLFQSVHEDPALIQARILGATVLVQDVGLMTGASLTAKVAELEALSKSAQVLPEQVVAAARAYWALSLLQDGEGQRDEAIKTLNRGLAWTQAAYQPLSTSAALAAAQTDLQVRLAWIGGFEYGFTAGAGAMISLNRAEKLGKEEPMVQVVKARAQIYLSKLMGGDPEAAGKYFRAEAGKDLGGAWNAFWAAEAFGQNKQKALAREWYQKALAVDPNLGLVKQALK